MNEKQTGQIVVFDPHPDDADWWTGGLTLLMKRQGWSVDYVCVGPTEEKTRQESLASAEVLGVKRHFLEIPLLRNPQLPARLAEEVANLFNTLKPRLVFLPPMTDYHQEHVLLARTLFGLFHWSQGLGFYDLEVYCYDSIENRNPVEIMIDVSEVWDRHIESLRCHRTFIREGIPENTLVYTKTGRAMIFGAMYHPDGPVRFAEGYHILQGNHRTISTLPAILPKEFTHRSAAGLLEM